MTSKRYTTHQDTVDRLRQSRKPTPRELFDMSWGNLAADDPKNYPVEKKEQMWEEYRHLFEEGSDQ